jgi:hypothetical protein
VVVGKWLGFAGMLTLYLLLMAYGVMAVVYLLSDNRSQRPAGWACLAQPAAAAQHIDLGGTALYAQRRAGVRPVRHRAIGGWIEQIGSFMNNLSTSRTAINIGIVTSLILPSEALWKRIAFEIQSPLVAALGFSPFSSSSIPSPMMIAYAVLYLLAAFALAIRKFQSRDF